MCRTGAAARVDTFAVAVACVFRPSRWLSAATLTGVPQELSVDMKIITVSWPVSLSQDVSLEFDGSERLHAADYDIALFPELMIGGYQVRDLWLSQDYLHSCRQRLSSIAQLQADWHAQASAREAPLWIIGGPHQHNGACYNAAFVLRKGEIVKVYHKNCLATNGVFDEHRYFSPGKDLCLFEHQGLRCGVLICEDAWINPVVERYCAKGVDVLLVLNASPFETDKQHRREQRMSILSRQYRTAFVLSNLCGTQDELTFDGIAFAYNAEGTLVQRSAFLRPGISELIIDERRSLRAAAEPAINPMPDGISQIHKVLTGAVREYLACSGMGSVVIGLSGGIDSAVVLCLAAEAVGAANVYAVMIVGPHTSELSIRLAGELADRAGVHYRTVDIGSANQSLVQVLRRCFRGRMRDVVRQNLQARLRCCVLAGLANQHNALLLNTTNKSEAAVGFGTLYGDLAGGISPLLDVTKQTVYQLAQLINKDEELIPDEIITRAPTAELAENQTDEESLMKYASLDSMLYYHLGLGLEFSELQRLAEANTAQFSPEQVGLLRDWIMRSEYKRRQSPMPFKISQSTFGLERRFPIGRTPMSENSEQSKD